MKNKGFTLIELLAVIVILAIIAIIAVPIILGIINDSKKQSEDRSAELYLDAAKKAIARYQVNNPDVDFSDVNECSINAENIVCGGHTITIEISGQAPISGTIVLSRGNVTNGTQIVYGENKTYTYTNGKLVLENESEAPEPTDESCFTYTTDKVTSFEINYTTCKNVLPTLFASFGESISNDDLEDTCTYGNSENTKFPAADIMVVPDYRQASLQYGVINSNIIVEQTNNAIITGYTCNERDVVIPSTIDGHPVTGIAFLGFSSKNLTSVVIPGSVKKIGALAFNSNSIAALNLGNGIEIIGPNAFAGNNIESVTIPNTVTVINRGAFYDNEIESLVLGNSVGKIGLSAFAANQIESLSIPNSVTTIGKDAFNINQISELTLGNGLETIDDEVFHNNKLTSVVIPNSVEEIGEYAFAANNIETVTIGSGITSIGNNAFSSLICKVINRSSSCAMNVEIIPEQYQSGETFGPNQLTSVTINNYEANVTVGNDAFGWASGYNSTNNLHWKTN